ncbi:hypothetical protein Sjap_005299 [Stephania japonica]|uniref:Uncharacterized protein n=1 Tax=Stephania japonica TaxID=461633 RepID=A0AAP0K3P7_9MAGN
MSPLLPALLILIFTISTTHASPSASEEVRDVTGKKLLSGTNYYIVPVNGGGGLGFGRDEHSECPLHVVNRKIDGWDGVPVQFLPVNPKKGMVRVSTDLNVKSDTDTSCDPMVVWKISSFGHNVNHYFVTTGGSEGNPSCGTLDNWFKIEKYEDDYKLMYCPSVCKSRKKIICQNIGIEVNDDGEGLLALSSKPFKVKFKKV